MPAIANTTFHNQPPPPMPSTSVFEASPEVNERASVIAGTLIGLVCVFILAIWLKTKVMPRYRQYREEESTAVGTIAADEHEEALWFDPGEVPRRRHLIPIADMNSSSELQEEISGLSSSETSVSSASDNKADATGGQADQQVTRIPQLVDRDSQSTVGTIKTTMSVRVAVEMPMFSTAEAGRRDAGNTGTLLV